jgi:serralysin
MTLSRRDLIKAGCGGAATVLLPNRAMGWTHGSSGGAASQFNLTATYTPAALAAPQSFRDGVQAAVDILKATIRNAITVTIEVDYGNWLGAPLGAGSGIGQPLSGSNSFQSYPAIRAALSNVATSADDISFVAALPNTSSIQSNANFVICAPVMKAIGLNPGTVGLDGKIGIGTGISTANLVGVALHELTHALGRANGEPTFDFGRFTSAGTRLFTGGPTSAAAYFSVDGGVTKLADFGVANDSAIYNPEMA